MKLSDVDYKILKGIDRELQDIELEIYRLESALTKLRYREERLKEQKRILTSYGKLIPAVIRDWWKR